LFIVVILSNVTTKDDQSSVYQKFLYVSRKTGTNSNSIYEQLQGLSV